MRCLRRENAWAGISGMTLSVSDICIVMRERCRPGDLPPRRPSYCNYARGNALGRYTITISRDSLIAPYRLAVQAPLSTLPLQLPL